MTEEELKKKQMEEEAIDKDRAEKRNNAAQTPQEKVKTTTPSTEKKPDEKIQVSKKVLDGILERMAKLEEDNELLLYASDKSRVARFQDRKGANITRTCRLRQYKQQVVIGWGKLIEDTVEKDGNGIWHESQIIEVMTEDGSKYKMRYVDFNKMLKLQCDIIGKTERKVKDEEVEVFGDVDSKLYYTLKVTTKGPHQGKEFTVAENFINS